MLAKQGFMVVRRPIEGSVNREIQRVIEQRRIATLIDVGAHEGRYGALWRARGFKGRIVSFEPAPSTFERLRKRAGSGWETHQYLDSGVHHRVAPRAYRGEFRRAILPRATTAAH
jgi:hypothetical protein